MGPKAGLDGRKISSPPGFDPDRPARSHSLYRLSYPAHIIYIYTYTYTHTHTHTQTHTHIHIQFRDDESVYRYVVPVALSCNISIQKLDMYITLL